MSDKYIDFEENKEELLKMKKVSELIAEVRPYFLAQKERRKKLHKVFAACACFAFVLFAAITPVINNQYDIINTITYHNLSAQDLGFPTDEYGLIMAE